jgi:peroxiredoxin (alkyl hydroperoxide reductase subunit C)
MTEIVEKNFACSLRIGDKAPDFRARTTKGEISLGQFSGRWVILFSHPADFTPVCTSEFIGLARAAERFAAMDCQLLGLSVDSLYAHIAWTRAIREAFDVEISFPVIEDPSMAIAQAYGMLDATAQDSAAVRASFFIDPQRVIRAIIWYPMTVGRSVEEMLRLLAALQHTAGGDVLTPEGWQPGQAVLLPPVSSDEASAAGAAADWFCRAQSSQ